MHHVFHDHILSAAPIDPDAALASSMRETRRELGVVIVDHLHAAFVTAPTRIGGPVAPLALLYIVQLSLPHGPICRACPSPYWIGMSVTPLVVRGGRVLDEPAVPDSLWDTAEDGARRLLAEIKDRAARERVVARDPSSHVVCHDVGTTGSLFSHIECMSPEDDAQQHGASERALRSSGGPGIPAGLKH